METNKITTELIKNTAKQIKDKEKFPEEPTVELQEYNSEYESIVNMNRTFAMKERLYENVLAPQLEENEKLKREHKTILVNNVFGILKWQFGATYIIMIVMLIMLAASSFLHISETLIIEVISFLKFYITSIIVELISILFFIIKNVFDTSITELFGNFDKNTKADNN